MLLKSGQSAAGISYALGGISHKLPVRSNAQLPDGAFVVKANSSLLMTRFSDNIGNVRSTI